MSTTDRELFPSLSTALRQGLDRTALSSSGTKKPVNDEDEVFRTLSRMLASLSVNFRVRARELTSLVDSTQMLSEENKVDEAIGLFERAIEARVAELGDNHIHTLELVSAFALFLSKHRRKKLLLRSKELYENLLKGYERELSWESVDTLKVAHDYARLLLKLGLLSQSKRLFIQILNYFEKIYLDTPHHPHILNTVNQMGSILKKEGNLRAARYYFIISVHHYSFFFQTHLGAPSFHY